jgi:organic radical activating enzyme
VKLLGKYQNGNYTVSIYDDGTKIRENDLDFFECATVEALDIKITNRCHRGCKFCHENSTPDGNHCSDLLNIEFLKHLHPYAELAIGGGNPLEHPQLYDFLIQCKERQFIPSMTVHQYDFEENFDYLKKLCDDKLIYGLGISLMDVKPTFIEKVKQIPSAVIHVINGIVKINQLQALKNNNLKILILGYKEVRRGKDLYNNEKSKERIDFNKDELYQKLPQIINENWFNVVSFDNLSIKQLDVKRLMSDQEWEQFYMGDDGLDGRGTSASMFVDVVEHKFAKNSCDLERFDLMDTIEDMYNFLYRGE